MPVAPAERFGTESDAWRRRPDALAYVSVANKESGDGRGDGRRSVGGVMDHRRRGEGGSSECRRAPVECGFEGEYLGMDFRIFWKDSG